MPSATVTSKGQITIPVEVRDALGIKVGDRLDFVRTGERELSVIVCNASWDELFAFFDKLPRNVSGETMDEGIARAVLERDERATAPQASKAEKSAA
jgi:antitoxin PrlF